MITLTELLMEVAGPKPSGLMVEMHHGFKIRCRGSARLSPSSLRRLLENSS